MLALRSWLRCGAAVLLTVFLLGLGAACRKSSSSDSIRVGGVVTYTRVPVSYDANGSPSGYGAALPGQFARGVAVRLFQLYSLIGQDGTTVPTWRLAASTVTDDVGSFTFAGIPKGYPTFVEVASVFQQSGGNGSSVRLIADPAGIQSTVAATRRPIYVYRMDLAGNTFTDPTSDPYSHPVSSGDLSLPITLTASETWAVSLDSWYVPGNVSGTANPPFGTAAQPPSDTLPLGSRALGILDSVYLFSYYYGDPTPSRTKGGMLDLHYWPGGSASGAAARTESPRRSFVVYDTSTLSSTAYDGTQLHYYGTLAGGPAVDDAWDPGVIYPLLARNNLWGQNKTTLFPAGTSSLPTEAPDLAVVDGLADALAATLLRTPYLTDTTASSGLVPRDIRTLPAVTGPGSPACLASLGWRVTLLANGISDGVGAPASWAGIDPVASLRFFTLTYPTTAATTTSTKSVRKDITSIYNQMSRLQEARTGSEPVDLKSVFNDLTLFLLGQPYQIPWTTAGAIPAYSQALGLNPVSQTFSFPLSMSNAQTVPNPDLRVTDPTLAYVYPDVSQDAVHDATLSLNLDTGYTLGISTDQALPAGASIEVSIDGEVRNTYLFTAANPGATYAITLAGNPGDFVNPTWHYLRFRLLAPEPPGTPVPDLTVTVQLTRTT